MKACKATIILKMKLKKYMKKARRCKNKKQMLVVVPWKKIIEILFKRGKKVEVFRVRLANLP